MNQSILILVTSDRNLRATVDYSSWENGNLINPNKEIGLSYRGPMKNYTCPIFAIVDGWKLLGLPTKIETKFYDEISNCERFLTEYEWWFTR